MSSFIPVDELMPKVTLEQVAEYYGVDLPEFHRIGSQIRSRCFLRCGKENETGDRALAIQVEDPARRWKCWQKGCGKSGNLISLCDMLKAGDSHGGRPRGERFKAIANDLTAIVTGKTKEEVSSPEASTLSQSHSPMINVPLCQSENERARELLHLDQKFLFPSDIAVMPPAASRYFRMRPWLTDEVARKWRIGYLPNDSGGDKQGGTMRGRIIYPYYSHEGELLCWFGRDPEFETKYQRWTNSDQQGTEPQKYRFVKTFHRGLELFGQHLFSVDQAQIRDRLQGLGLPIVAGPNDVIRLWSLGLPSVALCSPEYTVSEAQAEKIAAIAHDVASGIAWLLLPCTPQGEAGMRQCLWLLSQRIPVRLGWNQLIFEGQYRNREAEQLQEENLIELEEFTKSHSIHSPSV